MTNINKADFTPTAPSFKKLVYLNMQKLTNFPYIEADFDALTNYELISKVVEYLNQVIANNNEQNEVVTNLYKAFVSLQDFVNNYFENLDVQEEINNKLDEMAESGQLTDIIAQYLGLAGMIAFDTVADMKQATNLVNGSKCTTLGFRAVNDGGNASYKVRTITNDDVVDEMTIIALNNNNLIAELIIPKTIRPITLGAYGDGTHDDTSVFNKLNSISCKNIILNGNYLTSDLSLSNKEIEIENVTVSNFITFDNCVIKNGVLNTKRIELSDNNIVENVSFIYIDSEDELTAIRVNGDNNLIHKCNFTDGYYQCIRVYGNNTTIDKCNFDDNDENINYSSIKVMASDTNVPHNLTIKNCVFGSVVRGDNIDLFYGGKDILIDNNVFNNKLMMVECKTYADERPEGTSTLENKSDNIIFSNNICYGFFLADAYNITTGKEDIYPAGIIVENNTFHIEDETSENYCVRCGTKGMIIRNNTFYLSKTVFTGAISIQQYCDDLLIENNTIYGYNNGRLLYVSSSVYSEPKITLKNNVFSGQSVFSQTIDKVKKITSISNKYIGNHSYPLFTFNHNCFFINDYFENNSNVIQASGNIDLIIADNCKYNISTGSEFSSGSSTVTTLYATGYSINSVTTYGTFTSSNIDCTVVSDI